MNIYEIFDRLKINYEEIEHEPIFTILEAQKIKRKIAGIGCKTLFLKDRKGKYFLVVLEENKRADIKTIGKLVKAASLSFASEEELKMILQLTPGSVTPLGIINDRNNRVTVLIDQTLKNQKLLLHPNVNTKTVSIHWDDLLRLIQYENHTFLFI